MKAIFLGDSKPYSVRGLDRLVHANMEVVAVVGRGELKSHANLYKIPFYTPNQIYQEIPECDVVFSFGFWKKIKPSLIQAPKVACINFHPAPLPYYRGMAGVYNVGILEDAKEWEVTCHYVEEDFDTGDIIKAVKFPVHPYETAKSLSDRSHGYMETLITDVATMLMRGEELPRIRQEGEARYISRMDFEKLREVDLRDKPEVIGRKIRAFWCPPHHGACVKIWGKEYTLVTSEILKEL